MRRIIELAATAEQGKTVTLAELRQFVDLLADAPPGTRILARTNFRGGLWKVRAVIESDQ